MSLEIMALLNLSLEGEQALYESKKPAIRRALASNCNINPDLMNLLAKSKDVSTSLKALKFCTDQEILNNLENHKGLKELSLYRNINLDSTLLDNALTSINHQIRLAAYTNPSSSYTQRQANLTPAMAEEMVEIGGNVGDRVVRAYALVESNPFMVATAKNWSNTIRRAIAGQPQLTSETSASIRTAGWSGWESHKRHPLKKGIDITKIPTDELPSYGSSATDLEALTRADFSYKQAREIMLRRYPDAEPNVIAKIVNRYSVAVLGDIGFIAGTRLKSSAWLNPVVQYGEKLSTALVEDLEKAQLLLNTNSEAWQTFIKLYPEWEASAEELAKVVGNL